MSNLTPTPTVEIERQGIAYHVKLNGYTVYVGGTQRLAEEWLRDNVYFSGNGQGDVLGFDGESQ